MSLFSGKFFQPEIYEELPIEEFYLRGGVVADVLTLWDAPKDFNRPELLSDYPKVHWDNEGDIPSRMVRSWKTMYLMRIICDQTTVMNIARNRKYYVLTSEVVPNKQSNNRITHEEYWRLRDYLVDNGLSHAEAAFYVETNNTMKCVSNNIKDFLNEARTQ